MKDIKGKVQELILTYDTNCPFKIAKFMGVHIEFLNLGSRLGHYVRTRRVSVTTINQNASKDQQFFTCIMN